MTSISCDDKGNWLQRYGSFLKNKVITTFLTNRKGRRTLLAFLLVGCSAYFLLSWDNNYSSQQPQQEEQQPWQQKNIVDVVLEDHPTQQQQQEEQQEEQQRTGVVDVILKPPADNSLVFETLADVATYLRGNDNRLVRPGPHEITWKRQTSEACGTYLEQAHGVLARRHDDDRVVSQDVLVDAVHVITLCTTNRPKHRAKLTSGSNFGNVPAGIVSLLSSSSSYTAMAAAAECIWISSFSSQRNHQAFVKAGAISSLMDILTNNQQCNDDNKSKQQKQGQCYVAQMWAGVALQNMAAAYCDSDWGGCNWDWNNDEHETDGRHVLVLKDGMHVKFNPKSVRSSLIHNTKLLKTLKRVICANVKELDKAPWERTWPSRATVDDDEDFSSSVATWGAMGTVRNLALSSEFYDNMPQGLQECLCEHAVRSPDWLESHKATDAIFRLGLDVRHACAPLYDRKTCSDFKGWRDYEGSSCKRYEKERWCAEYRDYVPTKDEWKGGTYIKAGEACCACGGGNREEKN